MTSSMVQISPAERDDVGGGPDELERGGPVQPGRNGRERTVVH